MSSQNSTYIKIYNEGLKVWDLTVAEYSVAETVQILSGPKSPVPGWCLMQKKDIASSVNMSVSTIYTILKTLRKKGLVERKTKKGNLLRCTDLWLETVVDGYKNQSRGTTESEHYKYKEKQSNKHEDSSNKEVTKTESEVRRKYVSLYRELFGEDPVVNKGMVTKISSALKRLSQEEIGYLFEDRVNDNRMDNATALHIPFALSDQSINFWKSKDH